MTLALARGGEPSYTSSVEDAPKQSDEKAVGPYLVTPEPVQRSLTDALRAAIAGGGAAQLAGAAQAIFEAGGKRLLDASTRSLVQQAVTKGAEATFSATAGPLLEAAPELVKRPLASVALLATKDGVRTIGKSAVKVAGRQILKGAGRAAGIGAAIDGAIASVEAVVAVRDGTMDRKAAVAHVATEATTGAIATGAGVLLGAGLIALTGGVAAPAVFAVGAVSSIGTKRLLNKWIAKRRAAKAPASSDAVGAAT